MYTWVRGAWALVFVWRYTRRTPTQCSVLAGAMPLHASATWFRMHSHALRACAQHDATNYCSDVATNARTTFVHLACAFAFALNTYGTYIYAVTGSRVVLRECASFSQRWYIFFIFHAKNYKMRYAQIINWIEHETALHAAHKSATLWACAFHSAEHVVDACSLFTHIRMRANANPVFLYTFTFSNMNDHVHVY